MKTLHINSKKKFIFAIFKKFYNYYKIAIKYIALYLHKINKLAKQIWKTLIIIKNLLLI